MSAPGLCHLNVNMCCFGGFAGTTDAVVFLVRTLLYTTNKQKMCVERNIISPELGFFKITYEASGKILVLNVSAKHSLTLYLTCFYPFGATNA